MPESESLKRYSFLDGIRGIAAAIVIFSHMPLVLGGSAYNALWNVEHATRSGYLALDEFFLMSGFFITRILLEERKRTGKISLKVFYIRRTLRIFPIYYLALIVTYCVFHFRFSEFISILTYTFNYYHPIYPDPNPLEQTWSLSVEEQFYLFWPLLIAVIPLRLAGLVTGRIVPGLAIACGLLIAFVVRHDDPTFSGNVVYMSLCTRMLSLALGGWLAVRESDADPLPRGLCVVLALAGGALLAADASARNHGLLTSQAVYWTVALASYAMLSVSLTATLIFDGGALAGSMRRVLDFGPFRFLGGISYALYLFHLPVLYYFKINAAAIGEGRADIRTVGEAVALTLVLAVLSRSLVERPFMSLRRSLGANVGTPAARSGDVPSRPLAYE